MLTCHFKECPSLACLSELHLCKSHVSMLTKPNRGSPDILRWLVLIIVHDDLCPIYIFSDGIFTASSPYLWLAQSARVQGTLILKL